MPTLWITNSPHIANVLDRHRPDDGERSCQNKTESVSKERHSLALIQVVLSALRVELMISQLEAGPHFDESDPWLDFRDLHEDVLDVDVEKASS